MSEPDVQPDLVNHPPHYKGNAKGIECIDVVEELSFLRGNAIKYLWRAGSKGDLVQDLEKAVWYIQREIENEKKKPRTREPAFGPLT